MPSPAPNSPGSTPLKTPKKGAPQSKERRLSRTEAINQMCRDCIYDPDGGFGNWRQQVTMCCSCDCALWDWRPVSSAALPDSCIKGMVHHDLIPSDWCANPGNFYTRPGWKWKAREANTPPGEGL